MNKGSFATIVSLVNAKGLLVQRRVIVERLFHNIFERLFTLASLVVLHLLIFNSIRFLRARVQVLKGRVVVALVSKLLHNQLLDSVFDILNLGGQAVHSHPDLVILGLLDLGLLLVQVFTPLLPLSAAPDALLDLELLLILLVGHYVETNAVLFATLPLAVVSTTISPKVNTLTALLIIDVLSHEHATVTPTVGTLAVHHVVLPVAEIQPIIVPHEQALAVQHIVSPLADVSVTIRPAVFALALFRCVLVEAHVLATVVPLLLAKAMLFVLVPVTNVLAAVGMLVNTEALSHIVDELTLIKITTGMVQLAAAVVQVVLPETLIDGAIRPSHYTISLLNVRAVLEHLTRVDRTLLRVVIHAHVVHSQQLAGLVLLELVQNDLVALSESLARIMTAVVRLNLDNFLLITASIGEQNVIFLSLAMTAKVGRALALAID